MKSINFYLNLIEDLYSQQGDCWDFFLVKYFLQDIQFLKYYIKNLGEKIMEKPVRKISNKGTKKTEY